MGDFFWISGTLWLDAVNTERMKDGERVDLWPDVAALEEWMRQASTHHSEAEAWRDLVLNGDEKLLKAAKRLRGALRLACEAAHAGKPMPPVSLSELNSALARSGVVSRLEETPNGWQERESLIGEPEAALWLVARSAARSWTSGELARIKPCASPTCILWFLDTSKNGQRRWCSMQACGNRHKVTAHYERQKQREGGEV